MKFIFSLFLFMIFSMFMFENAWSEEYSTFYQPDGFFDIQYPSSWIDSNDFDSIVMFSDEVNWNEYLQIRFYQDINYDQSSDDEIFQYMIEVEKSWCADATMEFNAYVCNDFEIISTQKIESELPTYQITGTYSKKYEGYDAYQKIVFIVTNVVDKNNLWGMTSEIDTTDLDLLEIKNHTNIMNNLISSFNLSMETKEFESLGDLPTLEYYYNLDPIPEWADNDFYQSAVTDAIQKISKNNPWLTFRATSYEDSEIHISWIKEYGSNTLGLTHSTTGEVSIGMGDSLCIDWKPFNYEMLVDIIAHELLHGAGFDHTSNTQSIMYDTFPDHAYENEIYDIHLREWEYLSFPLCTNKEVADYSITITSQSNNDKFDVFVVESESDLQKYGDDDSFNHYSSCSGESVSDFNKKCENISGNSQIIIGTEDITGDYLVGTINLKETKYSGNPDYALEKIPGIKNVLEINAEFEADRLNYNKSILLYEKILESSPGDSFSLNNLGTVYHDLGDIDTAQQYYEKTLRIHPIDEFALSNIGVILQGQERYEEALTYFEKSLETNPENIFSLQHEREVRLLLEDQTAQSLVAQAESEADAAKSAQAKAESETAKAVQAQAEAEAETAKAQAEAAQAQASKGGGCLIATATYGSELAPQVQQLRELRDNSLLNTDSGTIFMKSFNQFYYSFSPIIADYERENPIFREMVKVAITPMISSLSILNYVDMDSDESVLGYGISLIILNTLMYVGIPASVIVVIRKL